MADASNSDDNRQLLVDLLINKFERVDSRLDKQDEFLSEIKVTLATNTVSLQEHMRRTAVLEKAVGLVEQDLSPIVTKAHEIKGAAKIIKWLAGGITAIAATIIVKWLTRGIFK